MYIEIRVQWTQLCHGTHNDVNVQLACSQFTKKINTHFEHHFPIQQTKIRY